MGCKDMMTLWYCGHHPRCLVNRTWAYEQAKARLRSPSYVILDTYSDLDEAEHLLSTAFPHLFCKYTYGRVLVTGGPKLHKNANPHPGISERTRKDVAEALGYDVQLYRWARQYRFALRVHPVLI